MHYSRGMHTNTVLEKKKLKKKEEIDDNMKI
jgi:hypothetical protein